MPVSPSRNVIALVVSPVLTKPSSSVLIPVWDRSLAMSIARSPSVPTIMGRSQRLPLNSSDALPSAFVPGHGEVAGDAAGDEDGRAVAVMWWVSSGSKKAVTGGRRPAAEV